MMKAKDFRQEQGYQYNHFTKLTNTGISPNYDNIEEYAEAYHQAKVKTLGLFVLPKGTLCACGLTADGTLYGNPMCEGCLHRNT